jgi:hypothetical protein
MRTLITFSTELCLKTGLREFDGLDINVSPDGKQIMFTKYAGSRDGSYTIHKATNSNSLLLNVKRADAMQFIKREKTSSLIFDDSAIEVIKHEDGVFIVCTKKEKEKEDEIL